MDGFEFIIFGFSGFYALKSIFNWYKRLSGIWPSGQDKTVKLVLGFLPVISFFILLYTLRVLASFDVVGDFIYILFYILIGYVWVFLGLKLIFYFFDLSWIDDVLNLNNKAALFAVSGAFLGLIMVYSGANIGDGPGWWCVIFAGGLGLLTWILLGVLINQYTQVFERVSVDRDMYCGIRLGSYLLASGLILGRASAGDWTSFSMTIVEFLVGWPVLLLAVLAVVIERSYINKAKRRGSNNETSLFGSIYWGIFYILIAVGIILLSPLSENPSYINAAAGLLGG